MYTRTSLDEETIERARRPNNTKGEKPKQYKRVKDQTIQKKRSNGKGSPRCKRPNTLKRLKPNDTKG